MNLLVVGSEGLAHAVAWKLAQSPRTKKVFVAPGNTDIALELGVVNIPLTSVSDLIAFANQEEVCLTVAVSETSILNGVVDAFQSAGLKILGPSRAADLLISSGNRIKEFLRTLGIPHIPGESFTDMHAAHDYIERQQLPVVIRHSANNHLGGKQIVAHTLYQAHEAIDPISMCFESNAGSSNASCILIEQFLAGEAFSFIALSDGLNALPLATCQLYKPPTACNTGFKAGGMGIRAPSPVVTPTLHAKIMREIILPTIRGIRQKVQPFKGFLQTDLIRTLQGEIKVLGLSFRPQDAVMQAALLRLKSDLFSLAVHAADSRLDQTDVEWHRYVALSMPIVSASSNDSRRTEAQQTTFGANTLTRDLQHADKYHIFHINPAQTGFSQQNNPPLTDPILGIAALGENAKRAHQRVCTIAKNLHPGSSSALNGDS